jgi:hypothetical protein
MCELDLLLKCVVTKTSITEVKRDSSLNKMNDGGVLSLWKCGVNWEFRFTGDSGRAGCFKCKANCGHRSQGA